MKTIHRLATLAGLTAVASIASTVAHEGAPLAQGGKAQERLQVLGRAVELELASSGKKQLYVMIDKPLYHPGETVWFRAWETSVKTLGPVPGDHAVTFQLFDPKGAKVMEKRVLAQGGMATNDFALGAGIPGGPYVLRAVSDLGATLDRAIVVSSYEAPRIKKSLDFLRKSYGPGDEVTAHLLLEKPTGEPLSGKATAVVTVDGAEIGRFPVFTDDKGRAFLRFTLPRSIARGDALITLLVDAGGISESLQRRIPIALDEVDVKAYPEGGDLVTGLPSRVYLAARDPRGKPVEIEGQIVDDRGHVVTGFRSFHAGMARVALTPAAGRSYSVKLAKPRSAAASKSFALPAAKASGCTLHTLDDFTSTEAEVRIMVQCTETQDVLATAVLRESLLSRASAHTFGGSGTVISLPVDRNAAGAVRVTLFDLDHRPLAERLVYRGLGSELRISVKADKPSYSPRDKVTLTVETRDARGRGVPADVALAVVDDTVLRFADDKSGTILARTYLLPEMPGQEVLEPNFYFGRDPKAPEAMDLLLGTQGWRRFAWRWVQ